MTRKHHLTATLAAVALAWAMAPAAFAQGAGDWDVPAGFTPTGQPSQAPSRALQGPITFSEAEFPLGTMVNGLVVNSIGGTPLPVPLTFAFSSADATVAGGPGTTAFIDDPSIEGDAAGTLTLDFGADVTRLVFGFAQSCGAPSLAAVNVSVQASGGAPVGNISLPGTDQGFFFLENQVDYTPGAPFRTAQITFDTAGGACNRFAFDNLAYDIQEAPTMPAAAAVALMLGLLLAGFWALRRRAA